MARSRLLAGAVAVVVVSGLVLPTTGHAGLGTPSDRGLRNVIHLVGDGMGFNQVDVGSLYEHGVARHQAEVNARTGKVRHLPGRATQVYQRFSTQSAMTCFQDGGSYHPRRTWSHFDEAVTGEPPDSAAAGTALATGVRTYNAGIGVGPDGRAVENLTERARALGKSSGVVSSVPFSHATPAAYVAHNEHRNNYHEISREMLTEHDITLIMAPGHPYFDADGRSVAQPNHEYISPELWSDVTSGRTRFEFLSDREDIIALADATDVPEHVFAVPEVQATLQYARSGPDKDEEGSPVPGAMPYAAPRVESVPNLAELTASALNVLDRNSDKGFFLMVEGGAIDWAGHENRTNRLIEEQLDFNRAVEAVVDWVERESSWRETLVVVTADHETGYLTGVGSNPNWTPIRGERGELPEAVWNGQDHTNSLVPLYAHGRGADALLRHATGRDPVRGRYLDNIDVAGVVFDYWR